MPDKSSHPDLIMESAGRFSLAALFAEGVYLEVEAGHSLEATLVDQLAISSAYLEEKLQTVFLNCHPVDDLKVATVAEKDVIALSAAMPGLVGATLRRAGHLAPMRKDISQVKNKKKIARRRGLITLKLFNLACQDLGPDLVRRGVLVRAGQLTGLLASLPDLKRTLVSVVFEGRPLGLQDLPARIGSLAPDTLVELKVIAAPGPFG